MKRQLLKPKHWKFRVAHLHGGNDPEGRLRNSLLLYPRSTPPSYVTVAELYKDGEKEFFLGTAICNSMDNPNRKRGYQIATRRALRKYYEAQR